jgi:potassium channel subfamily K, other eukaryote
MATEGWTYGISMYFCRPSTIFDWVTSIYIALQPGFVAFTTIGYGDYSPQTPAGRSVFVVWAILGVGTMTVLISGA